MTPQVAIATFAVAAGLLTITPGLDTALVMRTAAVEGTRRAIGAAVGISSGVLCWGIIAAMGAATLAATAPYAYTAIQWAGAAYLVWLGISMLRNATSKIADAAVVEETKGGSWFIKGFLTNILNPKVGLFYISFLPQFIPDDVNAGLFGVLLASIHVAMGMVWFAVIIYATSSVATLIASDRARRWLDGITGAALVVIGARIFLSKPA